MLGVERADFARGFTNHYGIATFVIISESSLREYEFMIIENGSYGKRMAKICEVAGIETVSRQFILSA